MSKFDAKKFLSAQDGAYGSYKQALAEIKNGKKAADRNDILDHYIKLQEEIIKDGSII